MFGHPRRSHMKTLKNNLLPMGIVMLCILFLMGGGVRTAEGAYFFDFDILAYPGTSSDIETYMESIYGSNITVTNAIVGNGGIPGPLGPDHYIQSDISLGEDWFEISFDIPIIELSFNWGSTLNQLIVEADSVEIFNSGYVVYDFEPFSMEFDTPVYTLRFHDHFLGEVGIDDLAITAVPVPGAFWLLGSGLMGVVGLRKKFNHRR
jgi:hypothetical protein